MSIMAVLSRKQKKYLERLFFDGVALANAVNDLRSAALVTAEQSADPTGRHAVENIAGVPEALGYKYPERWLQVVELTWARYNSESYIGKAMRRRYLTGESPESTCIHSAIAEGTYWGWRNEFLTYAAMMALKKDLEI